MLQIQYNTDLKAEMKDKQNVNTTLSKKPFKVWSVDKIKIDNKKYYLLVNKTTKLIILLQKLDLVQFLIVLDRVIQNLDYITLEQRYKLIDIFFNQEANEQMEFVYNKKTDSVAKKIKHLIEKDNIPNLLKSDDDNTLEADLAKKSILVRSIDPEIDEEFFNNMLYFTNTTIPIKATMPARHYQYMNLKMKFDNFSKWKHYEYKPVAGNEDIVKEIKSNNAKMVKQFISEYEDSFSIVDREFMILNYLDQFLLNNQILFATSNTGAVVTFLWLIYNNNILNNFEKDQLFLTFISFYKFLSRVGLIKKADAEKIKATLINLSIDLAVNPEDEMFDDVASKDIQELVDRFDNNELSVQEQVLMDDLINTLQKEGIDPHNIQVVRKDDIPKQNNKRNQMTYKIKVKLHGFNNPTTWRIFLISGNTSVENLVEVILTMFNANMEQLYDLYSQRSHQRFENPNRLKQMDADELGSNFDSTENKISIFEKGDKLVLSYDYIDGGEFDITIKDIASTDTPQHPKVISGQGYGIIDDIGGVSGLKEYFDTPADDIINPVLLDKSSGKKIDLLDFDIDKANSKLLQY